MVTVALIKHVCPLPATAALSCACALGTCDPSSMAEPVASSFTLEACGPQRAAGHEIAPEPSSVGRRVQSRGICGSTRALLSREAGSELWDT
jgi:hypothetical protein